MKIQSHNHLRNALRFFNVLLILTLLALLLAPNALACHRGKPHGKDTDCGGSDPGPPGISLNETWFADIFIDAGQQTFERAISTYESGDYLAQDPESTRVGILTNSLSKRLLKGKNDSDLCHAMDSGYEGPFIDYPETFSYGWTDDCRDTECAIEVSLSFTGTTIFNFTGGRSDRLEIVMYATASGEALEHMDEPFTAPQDLEIHTLELDYNKAGTTRSLVQCRLGQQGLGGPLLRTKPQ